MQTPAGALRPVKADLILMHAPAVFEFRGRGNIYFPYLSTSGDVPITPLYEYLPLGFRTLQRYLEDRGHAVEIVNLGTVLLTHPGLSLENILRALDARVFGIDLHWMVHVQGSLETARILKSVHPEVPLILGGITASYYARELAGYPFVDMVMRGYDTHQPVAALLEALRLGRDLGAVPNLVWKRSGGEVIANKVTHLPAVLPCGVDWTRSPRARYPHRVPILEVLSTQNAGCAFDCHWCGGSRRAFRRVFGHAPAVPRKPSQVTAQELGSLATLPERGRYHLYSLGTYNEPPARLASFLDHVEAAGLKSVSYEQHTLTPGDILDRMVRANSRTTITLSPESHDGRVARLAGRGVYTTGEMEDWIDRALGRGIHQVDVWFFVGMPAQDAASVDATVDYCGRLLRKFKGRRVVPLICPMIPFLDPASTFFEHPRRHGYRVFYRSLEEHRRGMTRASLINRLNYETRWLSREDIVRAGYRAVRRLTELKGEYGALPAGVARSVSGRIGDALDFIDVVHAVDCIVNERDRERELSKLSGEICRRNAQVLFGGVANQAFPVARGIGGRWFDESPWDSTELSAVEATAAGA